MEILQQYNVGRHCPVPKGLRRQLVEQNVAQYVSEDTALFQRD